MDKRGLVGALAALGLLFPLQALRAQSLGPQPPCTVGAQCPSRFLDIVSAADPQFGGLNYGVGLTLSQRQANWNALNAWGAYLCPGHTTAAHKGVLPAGTLEVANDGTVAGGINLICANGVWIEGGGGGGIPGATTITSFTAATPVLELGGHGNHVAHLYPQYSAAQAATGSASAGNVAWTGFVGSNAIELWGWITSELDDVKTYNATRGLLAPIAVPPSYIGGTTNGVFQDDFSNIVLQNISYRAIDLQPSANGAVGTLGLSGSVFRNIDIKGIGTGSHTNMNVPFVLGAGNQQTIILLNTESINPNATATVAGEDSVPNNAVVSMGSCSACTIIGWHAEDIAVQVDRTGLLYTGSNAQVNVFGFDSYNMQFGAFNYSLGLLFDSAGNAVDQNWYSVFEGGSGSITSGSFCPAYAGSALTNGRFIMGEVITRSASNFSTTCSTLPTNDNPVLRRITNTDGSAVAGDVPLIQANGRLSDSGFTPSGVLAQSGLALTTPSDTTEDILGSVAIPANAIGANGCVIVDSVWSYTNSANNKTLKIHFSTTNSISGSSVFSTVSTTTNSLRAGTRICNSNATNVNYASLQSGGAGSSGTSVVTSAIDTTAQTFLVFTGQKALNTESLVLSGYTVTLQPHS